MKKWIKRIAIVFGLYLFGWLAFEAGISLGGQAGLTVGCEMALEHALKQERIHCIVGEEEITYIDQLGRVRSLRKEQPVESI